MPDLTGIFKAYDVRGVVPDELDTDTARAIGDAFVRVLDHPSTVVVGRDMRESSDALGAAFIDGATTAGADVVDIGLASTEQLYFASGTLNTPGAMITASHNPAQYGGLKLTRAGAAPMGPDTGLGQIRERVLRGDPGPAAARLGTVRTSNLLPGYVEFLHDLVDLSGIRRLRVVVDAGNGMAGRTVPATLERVNVDLVPLYFDLDGRFPHHEANPIEPENLRDLQATVTEVGADVGFAFDGDADRCFVVDERAEVVSPSTLTALIAVRELAREPGATIVHNLITSRAVPEIVAEHGGRPVRSRVGHSIIKEEMARSGAVFGGEHSAHFYFRDFFCADSGMLAVLHVLAALGSTDHRLSELAAGYRRYAASGEINSTVTDPAVAVAAVREAYTGLDDVHLDGLDGLTVEHPSWWFNLRASNTEPLLRLNVEAADPMMMEQIRTRVLDLVRGDPHRHPRRRESA